MSMLRTVRQMSGLSQSELARMANITQQAVSQYENGRCIPQLPIAQTLARVLRVSIDDLWPPDNGTDVVDKEVLPGA